MAERVRSRRGAGRGLPTRRELEIDPALRKLFAKNLSAQGRKLINLMGSAVYGLAQPEVLLPIARHLGQKHRGYGVTRQDYVTFGAALFWMLRQIIGPDFGSDHALAWLNAYAVLSEAMNG